MNKILNWFKISWVVKLFYWFLDKFVFVVLFFQCFGTVACVFIKWYNPFLYNPFKYDSIGLHNILIIHCTITISFHNFDLTVTNFDSLRHLHCLKLTKIRLTKSRTRATYAYEQCVVFTEISSFDHARCHSPTLKKLSNNRPTMVTRQCT